VTGEPAPQGSKRHVGGGRMVEASDMLPDWRTAVALQVRTEMHRVGMVGAVMHQPVVVALSFRLRRPHSLPRKVVHHARKPDLDKLARSTLDALTISGLLHDDGQVCRLTASKRYAKPGEATGAEVVVLPAVVAI